MKKRKISLFLLILLSSFSPIKFSYGVAEAQNSPNVGFVSGNIWYSKDPFVEGDKIKIYTLVFNPDKTELSGTVVFFDQTVLLGKKDFTVSANGVKDVFIDWTVTAGDHIIFGKIENSKFFLSKGKYQEVYLTENETEKSSRTVKKIILASTNTNQDSNNIDNNSSLNTVQNIQKLITEKTPDFIAKPISMTANVIDGFRESVGTTSENKKKETKIEISAIDNNKDNLDLNKNKLLKPFKYVELFFLTLASFIFNNKFIFYGILAIITFFIIRFIWHKIF